MGLQGWGVGGWRSQIPLCILLLSLWQTYLKTRLQSRKSEYTVSMLGFWSFKEFVNYIFCHFIILSMAFRRNLECFDQFCPPDPSKNICDILMHCILLHCPKVHSTFMSTKITFGGTWRALLNCSWPQMVKIQMLQTSSSRCLEFGELQLHK